MSDNKLPPLVVFSGGMDSSFMLYEALKKGDVHTCYIKGTQHTDKIPAELEARRKIGAILQELTGNEILTDNVVDLMHNGYIHNQVTRANGTSPYTQGNDVPDVSWGQAFVWLFGLMFAVDGNKHSEVQIGNLMSDDIAMHLDNMKLAWDTTLKFSKRTHVPLTFPIVHRTKCSILRALPKEALAYIWVCDLPNKNEENNAIPCRYCASCIDHKKTIWEYEYLNKVKFGIYPKEQLSKNSGQMELFYNLI